MNEAQLEQLVADRVAAMRDAVPIRPDFQIRIMRAIEAAPTSQATSPPATGDSRGATNPDTGAPRRRRLVARELLLAFAVVVFVALLAGGAAWLRSQSHAAHHRIPAPTVSAASLFGVTDIHMVTAQVGWAFTLPTCSGCYPTSILRTTDGGLHWTDTAGPLPDPVAIPGGGLAGFPPAAFFLDSTHAWYAEFVTTNRLRAVIHSDAVVIHSSSDGGLTWKQSNILSVVPGGQKILLQFVDAQHGWITIGMGGVFEPWEGVAIYQTVDGGSSWNQVQLTPWPFGDQPTVGSLPVRCLKTAVFIDPTRGWASGSCGAMQNLPDPGPVFFYRTTDAGRTWSRQALPVPAGYPSNWFDNCICYVTPVHFPDPQNGTIVVIHDFGSQTPNAFMFITHDGGSTWAARSLPKPSACPSNPSAVDLISGSVGWVVACDAIYRTKDGGSTWTAVYQSPLYVIDLDFVDQSNGWAIFSSFPGPRLFHTSDGGRTWSH